MSERLKRLLQMLAASFCSECDDYTEHLVDEAEGTRICIPCGKTSKVQLLQKFLSHD